MHHPENQPPYPKVVVFMPRFIESNRRFELSSFCIEVMCEEMRGTISANIAEKDSRILFMGVAIL
jgi:hypothetical protein